jgi:hypothetical protein
MASTAAMTVHLAELAAGTAGLPGEKPDDCGSSLVSSDDFILSHSTVVEAPRNDSDELLTPLFMRSAQLSPAPACGACSPLGLNSSLAAYPVRRAIGETESLCDIIGPKATSCAAARLAQRWGDRMLIILRLLFLGQSSPCKTACALAMLERDTIRHIFSFVLMDALRHCCRCWPALPLAPSSFAGAA